MKPITVKRRENNAVISIRGRQYYDEDMSDSIELTTDGSFERQGDAYLIAYDETAVTGLDGTRTTILVEPCNRVTLTRIGDVSQSLIFEPGTRSNGHYTSEDNDMTLTVDAGRVINRLTDKGGSLFVDYQLEINSQLMSKNNFLIKIKEAGTPQIYPDADERLGCPGCNGGREHA